MPWRARLGVEDDRVVGVLDAPVQALVFGQRLVQLGFGGGGRGVGLDQVDRRVQVGVEDRDQDQREGDPADPVPLDPAGAAAVRPGAGGRRDGGGAAARRSSGRRGRVLPCPVLRGRAPHSFTTRTPGRTPANRGTRRPRRAPPRSAAAGCTSRPGPSATGAPVLIWPAPVADREVGDRRVLGLARAVGDHRRVAGLAGDPDRLEGLGQGPDLVDLDQDRVADAELDPAPQPLGVGDEEVVADELDARRRGARSAASSRPSPPRPSRPRSRRPGSGSRCRPSRRPSPPR